MKRIVFTVSNDLRYDLRMNRICSTLSQYGYDILLVGRKKPLSPELKQELYRQKRLKLIFQRSFFFYAELNFRLFFFLLFQKCDAICAVDMDTILAAWLVSRIKGIKLIYDAHEYFTEVPELEGRAAVKNIWDKIGRICIPSTTLNYTVSESLAAELQRRYKRNFYLIRNVPPENYFARKKTKTPNSVPTILYIGAVNKGRGLEWLIQIAREMDVQVIIAGDGDLFHQVEKSIKQYQLNHKITLTGYLVPEKIKLLTATADIGYNLLHPSSKSYYYSLSNKFFAYMHAGVPSISNNFPEYRKIVEQFDTGILIDYSYKQLKEAIEKLCNDPEYYRQLVENNLKAARLFNWKNESKKLITLYERIW